MGIVPMEYAPRSLRAGENWESGRTQSFCIWANLFGHCKKRIEFASSPNLPAGMHCTQCRADAGYQTADTAFAKYTIQSYI
jgi:hypothetical protein